MMVSMLSLVCVLWLLVWLLLLLLLLVVVVVGVVQTKNSNPKNLYRFSGLVLWSPQNSRVVPGRVPGRILLVG